LAAVFTVADRTPPSPLAAAARALREDQVRIGYDALVGRDVQLVYGAYVCDRVNIGDGARVAGFVCDGARIGSRSTVMGSLVHEYSRPHPPRLVGR